MQVYFDKTYGLEVDASGINESRACFESYDPEICIDEDAKPFTAFQAEIKEKQEVVIQEGEYTDYMKLNLAARMVRNAPEGERHNTLLRASILCGGYVSAGRMEEEEAVRVLLRERTGDMLMPTTMQRRRSEMVSPKVRVCLSET